MIRLPTSALWAIVRNLTDVEMRTLKGRLRGTRLGWLLDTLRQMPEYSDAQLRQVYEESFPSADERLLRVYKRQLWDVLEEMLPTRHSRAVGEEVRLWQRLWLSVILWERGFTAAAETLWRQSIQTAVEKGWYEVALWGVSLLEMYERDFHQIASGEEVSMWTQQLLSLITQRYNAISEKIFALEAYKASRSPKGWLLPRLPTEEKWALYMENYAHLIQAARSRNFEKALDIVGQMVILLAKNTSFLTEYSHFHLALTYANMGIILTNLRAWDLYEEWYKSWERAWEGGFWPRVERFRALHRAAVAIRIAYLVRTYQWEAARHLWEAERKSLAQLIFSGGETMSFRANRACAVFLVLLLSPHTYKEAVQWRLRVEEWMERESFRELAYLWWIFLRWYEAYRSGERSWMQHWYRKLKQTWQKHFAEHTRWKPILRVLRALTEALPRTQQKNIRSLLQHWEKHPEERKRWEYDSIVFPMPLFVESLLRKLPMENTISQPPPLEPLSEKLHSQAKEALNAFASLLERSLKNPI